MCKYIYIQRVNTILMSARLFTYRMFWMKEK